MFVLSVELFDFIWASTAALVGIVVSLLFDAIVSASSTNLVIVISSPLSFSELKAIVPFTSSSEEGESVKIPILPPLSITNGLDVLSPPM